MTADLGLGQHSLICCKLIELHFGEIVARVGSYLLLNRNRHISDIVFCTKLHIRDVRKAVAVLVQHNLVTFCPNERNGSVAEYSIDTHSVYCLLRYPRYLFIIKTLYGDESKILLEVLLNYGQSSASELIFRALKKLNGTTEGETASSLLLWEKVQFLITNEFFVRCPLLTKLETGVPEFVAADDSAVDQFKVPMVDTKMIEQKIRDKDAELGEHSDSEIVWRVNHKRFTVELQNVILVNAAARRVDSVAGELLHLLLGMWGQISNQSSQTSTLLSSIQIKDAARRKFPGNPIVDYCEQYLRILSEDSSELVTKCGEAGGGQFMINYENVFKNLACSTLDSIVLEKFGSKALRLFRLTRMKLCLEQDRMQQLSMIPAKEAKIHAFRLLKHNFLQIQELRKGTAIAAPVKSFFVFHVDLNQVIRTALQICYKGLYNTLMRREHELAENGRLLEKELQITTLFNDLKQAGADEMQLADVDGLITRPERTLLAKIHSMSNQLTLAEMQVDESILILETYLKYCEVPPASTGSPCFKNRTIH